MRRVIAMLVVCASASADEGGFCRPDQPCWPPAAEWQKLRAAVGGRLLQPELPFAHCIADAKSAECATEIENLKNPYFIQDQPGGTESLGWLGAWNAAASVYAVAAESPADVAAAVNFAREHRLRLVVKGTGHDYLGRSNAPGSLLVWTHAMRQIQSHDKFVPMGCARNAIPAVSLGAGTRWLEAYQEVTVKHGRYVQGGGCTSVGAAGGFLQGGGFGSWSKKFGIAAAGLLEAEVVTADGKIVLANSCQNQDLFWALRGGGGGTYGVVTRVTLMTHPLPEAFGFVDGSIQATSEKAFTELVERFLGFYHQSLSNEHWGEQVKLRGNDTMVVSMTFEGMHANQAEAVWKPFRQWLDEHPNDYTVKLQTGEIPAQKMWDTAFLAEKAPDDIKRDPRDGTLYWWAGDGDQVAIYWYAYQSRWIPAELFAPARAKKFAQVLVAASRQWTVGFHFNKGQAGAADEALGRDRETSMNPDVLRSAALVIIASGGGGHPSVRGHEPDQKEGGTQRARVAAAMKLIRDATPGSGSYVNETDYFEPDWKRAFWGSNYEKLLAIKHKVDPTGLFTCHHCVGSDEPRPKPGK